LEGIVQLVTSACHLRRLLEHRSISEMSSYVISLLYIIQLTSPMESKKECQDKVIITQEYVNQIPKPPTLAEIPKPNFPDVKTVRGYDFNEGLDYNKVFASYINTGF
jgi:hypothetical protein